MAVSGAYGSATVVTVTGQAATIAAVEPITQAVVNGAGQGPPGPAGPQGLQGTNASVFSASAGVTISAQTAVALINGVVVPAQNTVLEQFGNVVGVSQNGGVPGTLINIQQSGEISLSSWAWTLNKPVYVGPNGPLTQTAPTSGFLQIVGIPITPTSLSIGLQPPIILQ